MKCFSQFDIVRFNNNNRETYGIIVSDPNKLIEVKIPYDMCGCNQGFCKGVDLTNKLSYDINIDDFVIIWNLLDNELEIVRLANIYNLGNTNCESYIPYDHATILLHHANTLLKLSELFKKNSHTDKSVHC